MTVIKPNSISGVSSITAQGGDITFYRSDGGTSNCNFQNITGTAGTFTGNLNIGGVLTYEDVANIDSVGIITARTDVLVGNNIKLGASSGIVTATTFSGSGASLTNLPAGNLTGTVADARISTLTASKLSGALPAISAANLTNIPAANITGTLPAISGANLTGIDTDLVADTSPQLGGNLASNGNLIKFGDSSGASDDRLTFGNGDDIQIYYATSNLYITQATGDIILENTGTNTSNQIYLRGKANENSIAIHGNGAVELYDQSSGSASKKFETTSSGTRTTGAMHINDGSASGNRISVGNGGDLKIFHTNPTTFIQDSSTALVINSARLDINNAADNEQMARFTQNGAVELFHNGIRKFDTITTGIRVHGDEGGTAQLQLLADEGDDNADYWRFIAETNGILNIQDYGSGNWYNNLRLTGHSGGVELYHNNNKKFETTVSGTITTGIGTFSGNVTIGYDTSYSPIQQAANTWYYNRLDQAGSVASSNLQNLATSSIKVNETIPIHNMTRQSDAGAHSIYNNSTTSGSCSRDMSSANPFHPKAYGLTMGTLFRSHTSGNNGSGVIHYGANSTSEHFYIRYKYSSVGLNIGCDTNGSDVWTTMYQNDLVSDNNWYFVVIAVERNGTLLTSLNGAPLTPIRMLGTAPSPGNARFGLAGDPYGDNNSRHRYATSWWYKGVISNELIAQEYAWLKTIWTGASLP